MYIKSVNVRLRILFSMFFRAEIWKQAKDKISIVSKVNKNRSIPTKNIHVPRSYLMITSLISILSFFQKFYIILFKKFCYILNEVTKALLGNFHAKKYSQIFLQYYLYWGRLQNNNIYIYIYIYIYALKCNFYYLWKS